MFEDGRRLRIFGKHNVQDSGGLRVEIVRLVGNELNAFAAATGGQDGNMLLVAPLCVHRWLVRHGGERRSRQLTSTLPLYIPTVPTPSVYGQKRQLDEE